MCAGWLAGVCACVPIYLQILGLNALRYITLLVIFCVGLTELWLVATLIGLYRLQLMAWQKPIFEIFFGRQRWDDDDRQEQQQQHACPFVFFFFEWLWIVVVDLTSGRYKMDLLYERTVTAKKIYELQLWWWFVWFMSRCYTVLRVFFFTLHIRLLFRKIKIKY